MKKLLLGVVGLLVLLPVAVVVVLMNIDLNQYKPEIQKVTKDATGLELIMDGFFKGCIATFGSVHRRKGRHDQQNHHPAGRNSKPAGPLETATNPPTTPPLCRKRHLWTYL